MGREFSFDEQHAPVLEVQAPPRSTEHESQPLTAAFGKCEIAGCSCGGFISSLPGNLDICGRAGCGHRDYDHKLE